MSERIIDKDARDTAAANLAVALDVTYEKANEILESMDKEARK